jgi:hypothetical protein
VTKRLQKTGHRESRYERPNQKWVCGWACEGTPCDLGPDGKGRCPAKGESECTPQADGDRWRCTRLQAFGGPCEHGPNPDGTCCHPTPKHPVCRPVLSLKAKRGRLAWGAFLLTAAGLVLLVMSPWGAQFVSPGKLSSPHASLSLADNRAQNCQACHTRDALIDDAAPGPHQTLAGAIAGEANAQAPVQNAKCLNCHFQQADTTTVQNPHSASPDQLAAIIKSAGEANANDEGAASAKLQLASLAPPAQAKGGQMACATCHNEHQGKTHDLTAISNTQCQVCHDQQFANFPDGHPSFPDSPARDAGIAFDHKAHKARHFGDASFSCAKCHTQGDAGLTMTLRPFAQSCADCHQKSNAGDHHGEQIRKAQQVVLRLPLGLDGPWSRDAQAGPPELPATMLLLLAGAQRAETVEALDHLYTHAKGSLFDWSPAQDAKAQSSDHRAALVKGVQQLIADLQASDAAYWLGHRLGRALNADPNAAPIKQMASELSGARLAVSRYAQRWLPDGTSPAASDRNPKAGPGWHLANGGQAVGLQPTRHAAPMLKATFDAVTKFLPSSTGKRPNPQAWPQPDEEAGASKPRSLQAKRLALSRRAAQSLTSTEAPAGALASCMKCHQTTDTNEVAWQQSQRAAEPNGFSQFAHDTHFTRLGDQSCKTCHQLVEQSNDEMTDRLHTQGLAPYDKQTCSACHQPEQATNSCVVCHKYHWQKP